MTLLVDISMMSSRPVRGAWIETQESLASSPNDEGRAPCGARGLKQAEMEYRGVKHLVIS